MAIKHRGVKIVPVKTTRYEVRTVDNRKLMTFSTTASAKAWINGYLKAFNDLAPKAAPPAPVEAAPPAPKRTRKRRDHIGDAPST